MGNLMTVLLEIVEKVFEKVSEEAITHGGPKLLEGLMVPEPVTIITISALKILLPAIVSALFESTEAVARLEQKLDALIEGPLIAAQEMTKNAVSAHWQSPIELAERSRLLTAAADQLMLAYGNARRARPELADAIRLLQSIVAALRPEARPILELSIGGSRGAAADARNRAVKIDERVKLLPTPEQSLARANLMEERQGDRYLAWSTPLDRAKLETEASGLRSKAAKLERLCLLLLTIADKRELIFERLSSARNEESELQQP